MDIDLRARLQLFLESNGDNCGAVCFDQLCRGWIVCVVKELVYRLSVWFLVTKGYLMPLLPLLGGLAPQREYRACLGMLYF